MHAQAREDRRWRTYVMCRMEGWDKGWLFEEKLGSREKKAQVALSEEDVGAVGDVERRRLICDASLTRCCQEE